MLKPISTLHVMVNSLCHHVSLFYYASGRPTFCKRCYKFQQLYASAQQEGYDTALKCHELTRGIERVRESKRVLVDTDTMFEYA